MFTTQTKTGMEYALPNDSNELIKTRYEASIEVDQCPACQGMWLDQGELEAIQETRDRDYSAELNALPNVVAQSYRLAQARHEGHLPLPSVRCGHE